MALIDKESVYLLQKIDCNCNDCKFMIRDMEAFSKSQDLHKHWQLNEFNKAFDKATEFDKKKMQFVFNRNESKINYGICDKLKKPVQFIPGVCQIETQECFKHRKDL